MTVLGLTAGHFIFDVYLRWDENGGMGAVGKANLAGVRHRSLGGGHEMVESDLNKTNIEPCCV